VNPALTEYFRKLWQAIKELIFWRNDEKESNTELIEDWGGGRQRYSYLIEKG
jgi:hypothetical protein